MYVFYLHLNVIGYLTITILYKYIKDDKNYEIMNFFYLKLQYFSNSNRVNNNWKP